MSAPLYNDVPDAILELAGRAAAHAERASDRKRSKELRQRRWRRARAAAVYSLAHGDHYPCCLRPLDVRPGWERKVLRQEARSRVGAHFRGRQHPEAQLAVLRELVNLLHDPDDVDEVLQRDRVTYLRRTLFAPFGCGRVLNA